MMEQAQELLREVVQRGRTPKFAAALRKMESESASLIVHETGGRIRSIWDLKLGGVELTRPGESEEADREVRRFLAQHAELFEVDSRPERGLDLIEVRGETSQRLSYGQRHQGLRVVDGDFAAFFSEEGAFRGLSGAPWPENRFPSDITRRISESEAVPTAIEHVRETLDSARLAKNLEGEAELVVSGARRSVLWQVLVTHKLGLGVERELLVDAISGEVIDDHNLIAAGAKMVAVRCLAHKGGQKDDSKPGDENPSTQLIKIHVDPEPVGKGSACAVRLQRLGPFRARMWNARLSGGTNTAPLFGATMTVAPCNDLSQLDLFEQEPQSSTVDDSTFRFNEQNVYVWAQKLKTQLDEWGRKPGPGGEYGYDYPVETGRDVNVEIVVNGDSARESDWFDVKVNTMHGYFRQSPSSSWFPGVSEPHAVFFFNSIGNQGSPQFVGKEYAASYSIIAHEIGHFISWTYGYWPGSSSNMKTSLNEGMSMALPAVWGKALPGSSLKYTDSAEVTTGSFAGGSHQWTHHPAGNPLRYDLLDCEAEDPYKLAWPWVQAIWELANNINRENGQSIWTSNKAAVKNTADFLMDLLHTQAKVSDRNWNDIATRMVVHQARRHVDGREQGARPNGGSFFQVVDVLDHHGLFDSCT